MCSVVEEETKKNTKPCEHTFKWFHMINTPRKNTNTHTHRSYAWLELDQFRKLRMLLVHACSRLLWRWRRDEVDRCVCHACECQWGMADLARCACVRLRSFKYCVNWCNVCNAVSTRNFRPQKLPDSRDWHRRPDQAHAVCSKIRRAVRSLLLFAVPHAFVLFTVVQIEIERRVRVCVCVYEFHYSCMTIGRNRDTGWLLSGMVC